MLHNNTTALAHQFSDDVRFKRYEMMNVVPLCNILYPIPIRVECVTPHLICHIYLQVYLQQRLTISLYVQHLRSSNSIKQARWEWYLFLHGKHLSNRILWGWMPLEGSLKLVMALMMISIRSVFPSSSYTDPVLLVMAVTMASNCRFIQQFWYCFCCAWTPSTIYVQVYEKSWGGTDQC